MVVAVVVVAWICYVCKAPAWSVGRFGRWKRGGWLRTGPLNNWAAVNFPVHQPITPPPMNLQPGWANLVFLFLFLAKPSYGYIRYIIVYKLRTTTVWIPAPASLSIHICEANMLLSPFSSYYASQISTTFFLLHAHVIHYIHCILIRLPLSLLQSPPVVSSIHIYMPPTTWV